MCSAKLAAQATSLEYHASHHIVFFDFQDSSYTALLCYQHQSYEDCLSFPSQAQLSCSFPQ